MINAQVTPVFKDGEIVGSQREFINELVGLKGERYLGVFVSYGRAVWLVTVRHLTNRRTLVLKCYPTHFTLNEGGRILKQWPEGSIPD